MLNIQRMDYILNELRDKKTVYVADLAERYYVSPSTIRRDLASLEREGIVRRIYGGAVLIERDNSEIPYLIRQNERQQEKDTLCALAAELVQDDMMIYLDHTSTAVNMVKFLESKKDLKILTTSLQAAASCLDSLSASVYCTGGWLNPKLRGFTSEAARRQLACFYPDLSFFSARALSLEAGVTDVNEEDIYLKQEVLKRCKTSVLLCDSSKWGKISYRKLCELSELDAIVTDQKPDSRWITALAEQKVRLYYPK